MKPSGTVLIDALGIGPDVHVADFEFACKAGTEAMFVALCLVESGRMDYALAVGADAFSVHVNLGADLFIISASRLSYDPGASAGSRFSVSQAAMPRGSYDACSPTTAPSTPKLASA